ncbi:hypothetical protein KM1_242760, partial [Entamoeba histolytica HM-3:IMSS]
MSDIIPSRTKSTPATQLNCNAPSFKKQKRVEQPIAVKPINEEGPDIIKQKRQETIVTPTATPIAPEISPIANSITIEKLALSKTWKRSKPIEHNIMKNEKTTGATKQIDKKVNLEGDEKKSSGSFKFKQEILENACFVRRKKENKEENKTTSTHLIDEELQQNEKKIIKEKNNPQNEQPTMENQILITEGNSQKEEVKEEPKKEMKEEPKEEMKEEMKEEVKEDIKEKAEEKKPESKKEKRNKKRSYKREHEEEQIEEQEIIEIPPEEDEWKQVDKSGKIRPVKDKKGESKKQRKKKEEEEKKKRKEEEERKRKE